MQYFLIKNSFCSYFDAPEGIIINKGILTIVIILLISSLVWTNTSEVLKFIFIRPIYIYTSCLYLYILFKFISLKSYLLYYVW